MKRILFTAILLAAIGLTGCSSSSPTAAKKAAPKEPAKPVGGQTAGFYMFQVARQWAQDVQLLSLENFNLDEVKPQPGLYGGWRATFVSPSKRMSKTFSYSVQESGTIKQGVSPGSEQAYVAKTNVKPFYIQALKTDTPDALKTSLEDKDVKALAAKNPDEPIQFLLECTSQTNFEPAWRVIWGASVSQSIGSAYVAADSGKFIKRQR